MRGRRRRPVPDPSRHTPSRDRGPRVPYVLTKSSHTPEHLLTARVRARLRRGDEPAPEKLSIGDLEIDVAGHSVKRDGESLSLTPLEFDLLVALARKPWQVFTREVLLEQVWGYRHAGDTRLVNVHVQRLRSKIEHDPERPEIVVTVRGVGYKAGPT